MIKILNIIIEENPSKLRNYSICRMLTVAIDELIPICIGIATLKLVIVVEFSSH
jgi:hypothetical protein